MHRYEPFPENSSFFTYHWRERVFNNICKYSEKILVDASMGKKQLLESYQVEPEKVFPIKLIPPKYIYETKIPDDFDEKIHLPQKYLFYPAQFWEHKNHMGLIEAVFDVKQICSDVQLVLVGSVKNGYKKVLKGVRDLSLEKNVTFLGYVEEAYLPEIYRRAKAMIYPTFHGPSGIPPLEAMATGCPVAVSNIYALPEQCGDAALYFDPRSRADMAEVIRKLWLDNELCQRLRKFGLSRSKDFSEESMNLELRGILEKCIG